MLNITEKTTDKFALHHLGFRPFFLLAAVFAMLAMLGWWWLYQHQNNQLIQSGLNYVTWHAHEMLFGYAMAVIAGFLLTAVRNWTGVQTVHGAPLLALAILWLLARIVAVFHFAWTLYALMLFDLLFNLGLLVAVIHPVYKVKQWKQIGIIVIVAGLLIANALFYLGLTRAWAQGVQYGLYSGLYLVLYLLLLMGRRVIPFFIEKGVDVKIQINNRVWLDNSILILMAVYLLLEVFTGMVLLSALLAILLSLLHALRLYDWHTPGLWRKPLLWSLYLAYGWIVLGFFFKGISYFIPMNPMLAVHAFAVGGIGLMTLSMMCRVSLGHTGRNVFEPPALLKWLFVALFVAGVIRIILPLLIPSAYSVWIIISQWLWIAVFGVFGVLYMPMLIRPRVDGQYG